MNLGHQSSGFHQFRAKVLTPWPRETLSSAWLCGEKTKMCFECRCSCAAGLSVHQLTKQADILAFLPQKQDFWRRYWLRGKPHAPCKHPDDINKRQMRDFAQSSTEIFCLRGCFPKFMSVCPFRATVKTWWPSMLAHGGGPASLS